MVVAARDALAGLNLERFVVRSEPEFAQELERVTRYMQRRLPEPARWGTARKALNIFLRDVLYNTYLARELGFRRVERWLELPLDSYTVKALRGQASAWLLPRWPGVANVDRDDYALYQAAAARVGRERGLARVHLDVFWWRLGLP
jgi:hypothetical protein